MVIGHDGLVIGHGGYPHHHVWCNSMVFRPPHGHVGTNQESTNNDVVMDDM